MKRIAFSTVFILIACTFLVTACKPKPKLMLAKTSVGPGEAILVEYTTPKGYKDNAWVGIIPSGVEHGNETRNDKHDVSYKYLKGSTAGKLTFTAPRNPGKYDFRMHDTDSDGIEVAYVTFEVTGATDKQPEEKSTTAEAKFGVGDKVKVEWKGSWWPAQVIKVRDGKAPYKVHYDGYSNSWNEWVTDSRIKNK